MWTKINRSNSRSTIWAIEDFSALKQIMRVWLISLHGMTMNFGTAILIYWRRNGWKILKLVDHTLINVFEFPLVIINIDFCIDFFDLVSKLLSQSYGTPIWRLLQMDLTTRIDYILGILVRLVIKSVDKTFLNFLNFDSLEIDDWFFVNIILWIMASYSLRKSISISHK